MLVPGRPCRRPSHSAVDFLVCGLGPERSSRRMMREQSSTSAKRGLPPQAWSRTRLAPPTSAFRGVKEDFLVHIGLEAPGHRLQRPQTMAMRSARNKKCEPAKIDFTADQYLLAQLRSCLRRKLATKPCASESPVRSAVRRPESKGKCGRFIERPAKKRI